MGKAVLLAAILYSFDSVFSLTHSLRYVCSGTSGIPNLPEFVSVGLVDDEPIIYYDSRSHRLTSRQVWLTNSEGPDYWHWETEQHKNHEQQFKHLMETIKSSFNQTTGIHTVQQMYGCEWDDETGATGAHRRYGYDGSDFIVLDFNNMSWVASVPQAVPNKQKWDADRNDLEFIRNYHSQTCIEYLKKYVSYGKETLERKVPPEVSLLQKDSSSPLVCRATGFYPDGIVITWQKDGEDVHEDVEATGSLPNGDGTLQARLILRVSPEDLKNHQFSCVVEHVSLKENMVKTWVSNETNPVIIVIIVIIGIISCVVVGLLLFAAVARFSVGKKKNQEYAEKKHFRHDFRELHTTSNKRTKLPFISKPDSSQWSAVNFFVCIEGHGEKVPPWVHPNEHPPNFSCSLIS